MSILFGMLKKYAQPFKSPLHFNHSLRLFDWFITLSAVCHVVCVPSPESPIPNHKKNERIPIRCS